ncbi:hypothetical protein LguiB_006189 [Lonicera macranthoides]
MVCWNVYCSVLFSSSLAFAVQIRDFHYGHRITSFCFMARFEGMRGIVDYANYDDMRSRNMIEGIATQGVPIRLRSVSSRARFESYPPRSVSRHVFREIIIFMVTGLPSSASWHDLKDHMRRAGDVCFSQVFRDRDASFLLEVDFAIRKLDGIHSLEAYIRVEEYDRRRSYSRSPSRSPYILRSRSPSRSYSYSGRSRSVSPRAKRSHRFLSRSRSRSVSLRARSESYPSCSVSICGPHGDLRIAYLDQDPGLQWRLGSAIANVDMASLQEI